MLFDQKILVIRFSSIGDIVLTTSPLKTIRNAFPNSQISYLTLEHFVPLLEFHPDIDRLIPISKNMTGTNLWGFSNYIRKQDYSIIFDLHSSLRSSIVTLRTTRPVLQLNKPRWNRFILFHFHHNLFLNDFTSRKMYHEHLGEIWQEGDEIPETFLKVTNHEKNEALRLVGKQSFITMVPGAAWVQKQWSSEKYIELIQNINMPIVLLGEKKDKICFQIENRLPSVINLAGKTSLRQALAILSNSKHVIGSDTGLVHAAEALGIPVSMILGPTSKETGAGVHLEISQNIEKDLWCRPCSQNGKRPCYRKNQECMDSISVADVVQSVPLV
jgi:heptosyltransferase II